MKNAKKAAAYFGGAEGVCSKPVGDLPGQPGNENIGKIHNKECKNSRAVTQLMFFDIF